METLVKDKIVTFGLVNVKEDILQKFAFERAYCKKHNQPTLWTYFHYQTKMMQFADKKSQVRAINELWRSYGFTFYKHTNKPHMAKAIGARSVIGHVWKNESLTEANSESHTEPMSTMMGYMNAGNEVVTWEINW